MTVDVDGGVISDRVAAEQTYTDALRGGGSGRRALFEDSEQGRRGPDGGRQRSFVVVSELTSGSTESFQEGRTPDYYRRNPGILDLKLIRERDQDVADVLVLNEHMFEDAGDFERVDSRLSDVDSIVSAFSSQRTIPFIPPHYFMFRLWLVYLPILSAAASYFLLHPLFSIAPF